MALEQADAHTTQWAALGCSEGMKWPLRVRPPYCRSEGHSHRPEHLVVGAGIEHEVVARTRFRPVAGSCWGARRDAPRAARAISTCDVPLRPGTILIGR